MSAILPVRKSGNRIPVDDSLLLSYHRSLFGDVVRIPCALGDNAYLQSEPESGSSGFCAGVRQASKDRMPVQRLIDRHIYALLRQILYGAGCNRIHSMEERCARWLLMTHDRAGDDMFPLTQEFLSHMLGVRRATVNVATCMLKKAGFIRYVRGKITVLDRPGLESASYKCYTAIVQVYKSLESDNR